MEIIIIELKKLQKNLYKILYKDKYIILDVTILKTLNILVFSKHKIL